MDLFVRAGKAPINCLPKDGEAYYHGYVLSVAQARHAYTELLALEHWAPDEISIAGVIRQTRRQMIWCGARKYNYRYSGTTRNAVVWPEAVFKLKAEIEAVCGEHFNSCLLNYYPDGDCGMAWHSDSEQELVKGGSIASVSLGATRRFDFRHVHSNERIQVNLAEGSLLVMQGCTQKYWQHQLPKIKAVRQGRINLTFRQMQGV